MLRLEILTFIAFTVALIVVEVVSHLDPPPVEPTPTPAGVVLVLTPVYVPVTYHEGSMVRRVTPPAN